MLGETEENWQRNIEKTIELEPDSVTIYQMELPYNTTITKDILQKTGQMTGSVAGWDTKRRWVQQAFEALERAGYHIGSAYTAVKDPVEDEVHLPRSPVAGGRHGRPRRRLVRPRQRRPRAEQGHAGRPTARRSSTASCRSAAPIARRPTSGCGGSWCCR